MFADLAVTLLRHADVLILHVAGVLDITTANRFAAEIAAVLAMYSPRLVVLDLCALDLLAAAGVRVLLETVGTCARRGIATAVACDPSTIIHRAIRLLRVNERVAVYSTANDAVAAMAV